MDTKAIRTKLGRLIQLELKDDRLLAHVNVDALEKDFGVRPDSHIMSGDAGIALFNTVSQAAGVDPIRDPKGYMALDDNIFSYIHKRYGDVFESRLYDVEDSLIDGTGYGLNHVLQSLNSTVRSDIKEYLPEGMIYSDMRFIPATAERKDAVNTFVDLRVSKTLMYEMKRSYEPETIERNRTDFIEAGKALGATFVNDDDASLEL